MELGWMAWTWPTAAFFLFIACCLGTMTVLELRNPGGTPRDGVLGLTTTRGDRLFIWLLGSAFIFLAWLGLASTVLWMPLGIAIVYGMLVFRYV